MAKRVASKKKAAPKPKKAPKAPGKTPKTPKAKVGRPPKASGQAPLRCLRVEPKIWAIFKRASKKKKQPLSLWLREAGLKAARLSGIGA